MLQQSFDEETTFWTVQSGLGELLDTPKGGHLQGRLVVEYERRLDFGLVRLFVVK